MNEGIEFTPVRCKKISFLNEAQAIFYIDKLKNTSTRTKVPTRAYLCQDCLNWHLTSKGSYAEENPLILELQNKNDELKKKSNILESKVKEKDNRIKRLERNLVTTYAKIKDLNDRIEKLRNEKFIAQNKEKLNPKKNDTPSKSQGDFL